MGQKHQVNSGIFGALWAIGGLWLALGILAGSGTVWAGGVPLIGDNGIVANGVAGCPVWTNKVQGVQFPNAVWKNPTKGTIYITGFSMILEVANNVKATDVWASIYRRSDMSRLYNALHEFRNESFRANDQRQFAPNYFILASGDALLLEGGCVAYDSQPAKDAGLVLNVFYSTVQP